MGAPPPQLAGARFVLRRKILKLIGAAFYVHDANDAVVLYADQKAFKLKEDIRVYSGEDKTVEVLRIAARSIMDFSAAYDVYDSASNQKLGVLRRKGMKSIVRDEWQILDAQDREMGLIQEDSTVLALMRRFIEFIALLVPQKYSITVGNRPVGQFTHVLNPFSSKIEADFSPDTSGVLDRRLALAAGVLMCAIEGKQG
ncbi:MAG: hypothetical protein KY445_10165 [Armatimonadetes bacterium]|nr:hypothetical protein [Armatimonadota bacterium]